jgi:hypothetical protein
VFTDDAAIVAPTRIPEGAPGHRQAENFTIVGLGEYLTTTVVLVVAVLYAYRRSRQLPPGLTVAVVAAVALGGGVLTQFAQPAALLGAVAGGLAADVVVRALAARAPHLSTVALGAALPALVWPGQLAGLAVSTGVAWSTELWAGIVILTGLAGVVLGSLALGTASLERVRKPARHALGVPSSPVGVDPSNGGRRRSPRVG